MQKALLEKTVMQKLLRKADMAKRQSKRRYEKRKAKSDRDETHVNRVNAMWARRSWVSLIKDARIRRREDWELGSLAPKRDVGDKKDTYGTVDSQLLRGPILTREKALEKMEAFGGKFLNLTEGDRVVITEGRDKGKIGKVSAIDKSRAECTVEGLNLVDVAVPEWMIQAEDTDKRPVRSVEQGISLAKVRLVYPLTDEETGVTRDVIVKKLVNGPIFHDKHNGSTKWSRLIPGLNIKVPWPKKDPVVHPTLDCDTQRLDVEVRNFVPTLLRPPMPLSVIDELRNKYSKFRTRHDPEYIEKKIAEEREKLEQQQRAKEMMTPLAEFNKLQRKARKAKGKGKLTSEMLERIGEVIVQKRQLALNAAGMSKEQTPEEIAT